MNKIESRQALYLKNLSGVDLSYENPLVELTATPAALALLGYPSSHTAVWTQKKKQKKKKNASVCLHLILLRVLLNPFDLLIPPQLPSTQPLLCSSKE